MEYKELIEIFTKLKEFLKIKKQAIIKKQLDKLNEVDEEILVISETFKKKNFKENLNSFDENQKKELKKLAQEIKDLENNNEILIKHSLEVIDGLLSGVLNIVQKENRSYNSKGMDYTNDETYQISSITEEA